MPLVVRSLTGKEIKELVQNGKVMGETAQTEGEASEAKTASFGYCWAGMEVDFKNGAVASAKLEDGTPIEDDAVYRVQFAKQDYELPQGAEDDGVPQEKTPQQVYEEYLDTVDKLEIPKMPERE